MVKAWRETVVIPTYEAGAPEKNPIFLEKRVYQGSSGVVYPYPVIESIADEKHDKEYAAVFLENEYIKVMILPELGGRVQMAYDKIAKRHFIYYNQVIKPALVGLAGPWISGGIEFNWPQHHRPSTFMPVDCTIEEHPEDGSVTVWCGERERMFHQKGTAGFTLRPGCAYLEIKGVLYNPTEVPQTFLWWANPAVKVNDAYQSVFPPDVNAVFDHGKRAVSTFPIATGVYYKMDYSAGVDISNYKNIYVPTSYMVAKSAYDFEGGYENDTHCGMLHVANHRFSPGKKQWTWGNGDFGRAWDRNLTDEDGPYIELMAGVYTENQPDFSWLMPYEEKSFVQYFFPYRELGIVKNASRDLVLNILPAGEGKARILVYATSRQTCRIRVTDEAGQVLYSEQTELGPEDEYDRTFDTGNVAFEELVLRVNNLSCAAAPQQDAEIPAPAEAALKPSEIDTCEQLYLTGLHLEQYRHATWSALDYYEEALRRDPLDVRNNNAVGLWYIRRGRFAKAEPYLRTAVRVLQRRNLNPYDGEPLYNLALCLKYQGRLDEAYDWFYKATWNAAWQDAGYFACAQISAAQGRWEDALDEVDHALYRNWHNHRARALKTAILRHLGRREEALSLAAASVAIDPFNFGCRFEQLLMEEGDRQEFVALMRGEPENYDETALDYCAAGLYEEADALWALGAEQSALSEMSFYYWKYYCSATPLRGSQPRQTSGCAGPLPQPSAAGPSLLRSRGWLRSGEAAAVSAASAGQHRIAFPNRLEAIEVLGAADGKDARAAWLLGNLWYDKRQYDLAQACWEKAVAADPDFPGAWRCLALVLYNKRHDAAGALAAMERAYALDETDARILMELDQLHKKLGSPAQDRLDRLEAHRAQVESRDDLVLEEITLLNDLGRYEEAMTKLDAHHFHPWEGGEGKVPAQYQRCRVALALQAMTEQRFTYAVSLLSECLEYPPHLGEGKLYGAQEQDFYYYLGCARMGAGEYEKGRACWEKAAQGDLKPVPALYYNDAKPEKIYYQGLALAALGRRAEAEAKFRMLLDYGTQHRDDEVVMDYFAVSLPDLAIWDEDLKQRNVAHCDQMISLGREGLVACGIYVND
ncbi:MAG: DUF5107 domain-containing protein [Bacteroidales bacterium]|nr:DUF5107 domain-containing protein [Bacteroidales bacterium]